MSGEERKDMAEQSLEPDRRGPLYKNTAHLNLLHTLGSWMAIFAGSQRIDALNPAVPGIPLFMKRPLSQPRHVLTFLHNQVFNF